MRFSIFFIMFLIGCGGPRGQHGRSGANCYDDIGDLNGDGETNTYDCLGSQGSTGDTGPTGSQGPKGDKGDQGEQGVSGADGSDGVNGQDGKDYEAPVSMEGFFTLPNGGYIELIENADKEIVIYGTQRLYTTNFDGGLALHPNLPVGPHNLKLGIISGEYNTNYNSTTNDVEVDGGTGNIAGVQKTYYKLWLTATGKLKIQILVYSDSGLNVDVNRTITSN